MDEYNRLLGFQQTLEKETTDKIEFIGLSVDETIKKCLFNGMSKRADKLKSDFKVPDKRYETESSRVAPHVGLLMTTTTIQVLVPKATHVYYHPGL